MGYKVDTLLTIGSITMSDTTEYRVSLVKDMRNRVRVSLQVWWRKDNEEEWVPGKGFNLTRDMTTRIVKCLRNAMDCESSESIIPLSDTQRYHVSKLIDKDLVVISKWWHKGDHNWTEGKSLALPTENIPKLASMLEVASKKVA